MAEYRVFDDGRPAERRIESFYISTFSTFEKAARYADRWMKKFHTYEKGPYKLDHIIWWSVNIPFFYRKGHFVIIGKIK